MTGAGAAEPQDDLTYRSLDHWRGIAALLVVVFHCFWALGATVEASPALAAVGKAAAFGYLGVYVFFVVSGYCIAASVHRAVASKRSAASFLLDRFLRIYPVYWAALIFQTVTVVAAVPFSRAQDPPPLLPESFANLAANLTLTEPYFHTPPAMIVTWTLTCEVGFYLLVGLGLAGARRVPSLALWASVGIVLAFASFGPLPEPLRLLLGHWPAFVCGGLVYLARYGRTQGTVHWRIVGALVVIALAALPRPAAAAGEAHVGHALAAAFALLLYLLAQHDRAISRLPGLDWLARVGVYSYSLYLIHVPILLPAINALRRVAEPGSLAMLAGVAATLAIAARGGYVFHRVVESPFEDLRRSARRRLASGAGARMRRRSAVTS